MTAPGWAGRPLTFVSRGALDAVIADPAFAIVAEPCGCAGRWVSYRAATPDSIKRGGRVVLTHEEARAHRACSHTVCGHVTLLTGERAADMYS